MAISGSRGSSKGGSIVDGGPISIVTAYFDVIIREFADLKIKGVSDPGIPEKVGRVFRQAYLNIIHTQGFILGR